METQENINEIHGEQASPRPRISALAVTSIVFGILGPFIAGIMWVTSFNDFITVNNPYIMAILSCGLAWILGLVFGVKSLEKIENSHGHLVGKECAVTGVIVSTLWMFLILICIILPAIYTINS